MPPAENILVLNSGSSSLKFGLFAPGASDEELILEGSADGIGRNEGTLRIRLADGTVLLDQEHVLESQQDALGKVSTVLRENTSNLRAVGHRVVHGGPHLLAHQRITPAVMTTLEESVHFAPLHIPLALHILKLAELTFPSIPQFACFDTVFHRTMPEVASRLPLPSRYFDSGVRRYGFHGLSYESLVHQLRGRMPVRAVFAHLGNGASVTAVLNGISIDTTMGLTPTGGVLMGSRSGDLDPGLMLYLARVEQMDPERLETFLNHECGMAGLSDGESDMQALLALEATGHPSAHLAVNGFCTAVKKSIGAYAALMGGIDLLVFTGGIGLHSEAIRARICVGLEFLNLTSTDTGGKILVLKTEEEIQIARHVRHLLTKEPAATFQA